MNPLKNVLNTAIGYLQSKYQPEDYLKTLKSTGKGKNIIITGASSGLGAGMARHFASLGYDLGICARRLERLEELKAELESQHGISVNIKQLDVSDYDAVFEVFHAFKADFGHIDRIVVNAGIGNGRRVGRGKFDINRKTAEINFISALAQSEATMEIFREQNAGHLVMISSISAYRGLPKHLSTYAASKAAAGHLAEGIKADMLKSNLPIDVTIIYPGYIRTEINEGAAKLPFEVDSVQGTACMVAAIERKVDYASIPAWPWEPLAVVMKHMPLKIVNKLTY